MPVDLSKVAERRTPKAWADKVVTPMVSVLPLIDGNEGGYPGWCSYDNRLQSPDVEILCGGTNTKIPTAAGIWRQGHLLHFGFEPSPAELNDNGRALLTNSIAYIARFTEDQALVRQPSPFAGPAAAARAEQKSDETFLQIKLSDEAFFDRCAELLKGTAEEQSRVIALLSRSILPSMSDMGAAGWTEWLAQHQPYLFFSTTSADRWVMDRLALQRGVPSKDLRGPARADRKSSDRP